MRGARGADRIVGEVAKELGYTVEVHEAQWDEYGRAAGHIRNKVMVDLGADIVLAFPIGKSSGTRGCMNLAEKAGIPVINVTEKNLDDQLEILKENKESEAIMTQSIFGTLHH